MSNSKTKLLAASTLFLLASTAGADGHGGMMMPGNNMTTVTNAPRNTLVSENSSRAAALAAAINKNKIAINNKIALSNKIGINNKATGGKGIAVNKNNIVNKATGGKVGDTTATGGKSENENDSSASTGPISITDNYETPIPIGNAPAIYIQPTGDCGDGWSLSVGGPYGALGGGQAGQDHFCISNKAALAAMNAGLVSGDNGLIAAGFGALRKLHPEFEAAASIVSKNLVKDCGAAAGNVSVVLLSEPDLVCEGQKFIIAP